MKSIVITGSTRGIGRGLAVAFLERGCRVTISGRSASTVEQAVAELRQTFPEDQVFGQPCDVAVYDEVQALWNGAMARFGSVDIWINNAGINAHPSPLWELSPQHMEQVVKTNLVGTLNGCSVAMAGMRAQGHGSLYNMEGLGSDGRLVEGMSVYGTTKSAITYLTKSLVRDTKKEPFQVCFLSPGMVITHLLVGERDWDAPEWKSTRTVINILADRVERV